MNILTQASEVKNTKLLEGILLNNISSMLHPVIPKNNNFEYFNFISNIDKYLKSFAVNIIKQTLEKMDIEFKNQEGRVDKYYIKNTRCRSIVTLYGVVTYKRVEYIDRKSSKPFCYIDRKLGIKSRQRYDNTIITLANEMYSDSNSMIKVGKLLGDRIHNKFSIDTNRHLYSIPRQTIYRMVNTFKSIQVPIKQKANTPKTLYIMADEKFIPIQNKLVKSEKPRKEMVKVGVIFEGKSKVKAAKERYELTNKHVYINTNENNFWEDILNLISEKYRLEDIEKIYILGDGASWIKQGVKQLTLPKIETKYALDIFHFKQAINNIIDDKDYKNLLINYIIKDREDDYKKVIKTIIELNPGRAKIINDKSQYILSNLKEIQTIYEEVKIGCSMEQAISHIIASIFTSVPKGYSKERLQTYLNLRENQQNGHEIRQIYCLAFDQHKEDKLDIYIDDTNYNFEFFDSQIKDSTYKVNLLTKSFNLNTPF